MNIDDLPDDSDTSDEDYNPGEKQEDVSEVDSDGDAEDQLSGSDEPGDTKRKQSRIKSKKLKKVEEIASDNDNKGLIQENTEEKKKNDDDIWADFMKDTGFQSKNSKKPMTKTTSSKSESSNVNEKKPIEPSSTNTLHKPVEKVKITQVFEFAGEEVRVEKEVPVDSAEARLLSSSSQQSEAPKTSRGKRAGGLSGIGNVLSQLTKKPKISTLDKTKLDWEKFKKEEKIEEELQTYNKGKDGYLDRQDFLERADLRRFEIEKEIRSIERNKRFNSNI